MKTYKVFPDYCSTGLWDSETGVSEDIPKYIPIQLVIMLRMWHELWEFAIADYVRAHKSKMSWQYIERWDEDGRYIVYLLNTLGSDTYIYEESTVIGYNTLKENNDE